MSIWIGRTGELTMYFRNARDMWTPSTPLQPMREPARPRPLPALRGRDELRALIRDQELEIARRADLIRMLRLELSAIEESPRGREATNGRY